MFTTVNSKGGDIMANRSVIIKNLENFIEKIVKEGLSYRQLAKKCNTSQTTISLIAKGERNPGPELAINICKALNCQFDDIFLIKNVYNSKLIKS